MALILSKEKREGRNKIKAGQEAFSPYPIVKQEMLIKRKGKLRKKRQLMMMDKEEQRFEWRKGKAPFLSTPFLPYPFAPSSFSYLSTPLPLCCPTADRKRNVASTGLTFADRRADFLPTVRKAPTSTRLRPMSRRAVATFFPRRSEW